MNLNNEADNYYQNVSEDCYSIFIPGSRDNKMQTYMFFILTRFIYSSLYWNIPFIAMQLKENLPEDLKDRYVLKKFILPKEIGWVYKQADVILSRSGANTVAELIALHKKALLIPLPFGQQEEQLENAKYYESTNLGEYILQKNVNLNTIIKKLLSIRESKIPPIPSFKNDAAEKIAQEVFSVLIK